MEIAQSTILITGASSGFGRELAIAALDRGAQVVATARNVASLEDLRERGGKLFTATLDVSDEKMCQAVVSQALERFGSIDILVNNAGYGLIGSAEEASDDEIIRLFDVNIYGCVRMIRAVLPEMRKRRHGMIVNMSSRAGVKAVGGSAYYAAAKFALEGLSEALAEELAPLRIKVLVIEPGAFRTNYSAGSLVFTVQTIEDYSATSGNMRARVPSSHGTQPGDPEKAAHTILDAIEHDAPPFRLPLGAEAAATIERVYEERLAELRKWRRVAEACDYGSAPSIKS